MPKIINFENEYYLKWSKSKNRLIWIRSNLSHYLALSLAVFTVLREISEHLWKGAEKSLHDYILNKILFGGLIIEILSWMWFLFIIALVIGTILAAIWELKGNKLDVSEQEKRFALGMKALLLEIEKLKQEILKANTKETVNSLYETFIDFFLKTTSNILCGEQSVHAGLMLYFPNDKTLRLIKSTPNSNYPVPGELVINLDETKPEEKGPAQMAFEKDLLGHMPEKSKKLGWLLQERENEEYVFDRFIRGWSVPPPVDSGYYESVISIPITSYAEEGKKAYHGVLNFTNEKKDHFILRDYTMAFCFASIIAQAQDVAKRKMEGIAD